MNIMKPYLHFMKRPLNILEDSLNIMKHRFHFAIRPRTAAQGRRETTPNCPSL